MTYDIFEIAAGTPFFHGTYRAVDVIKKGVKPSTATPAGKEMTGFRWFFSSFSPALAYLGNDDHLSAVIEFKTTRLLRFGDLRSYQEVRAGLGGPEPNAEQIKKCGLDGVVIGATGGGFDYEYGFVFGTDLAYVGYESPPDGFLFDDEARDFYWAQPPETRAVLQEIRERRHNKLREKLEQALAESE